MNKFMQLTKDFINDEEGLTVVEYVIGAALLVGALTAVFNTLNTELSSSLDKTLKGINS